MSATTALTGEDLLNEVYDLLCDRLARLPADDPVRATLAPIMPTLARQLDRSHLKVVS